MASSEVADVLDELNVRISTLEAALSAAESENSALRPALAAAEVENADLRAQIEAQQIEIARLNGAAAPAPAPPKGRSLSSFFGKPRGADAGSSSEPAPAVDGDSADFALALQLQAEEEAAAAASSGEPGPSDDNDVELLSVTLHRADDGSLGLLVEYEGGLPVVAAPAPGGLVTGDVITAIDGVTLQPGWKLSDVIERRELHELQVLRHT